MKSVLWYKTNPPGIMLDKQYRGIFNMTDQDITFQFSDDGCKVYALCDGRKIGSIFFVKMGSDKIMISESEIEPDYKNSELELLLTMEIIKLAREQHRKIMSICPYITNIFTTHPEFDDVRLLNNSR